MKATNSNKNKTASSPPPPHRRRCRKRTPLPRRTADISDHVKPRHKFATRAAPSAPQTIPVRRLATRDTWPADLRVAVPPRTPPPASAESAMTRRPAVASRYLGGERATYTVLIMASRFLCDMVGNRVVHEVSLKNMNFVLRPATGKQRRQLHRSTTGHHRTLTRARSTATATCATPSSSSSGEI